MSSHDLVRTVQMKTREEKLLAVAPSARTLLGNSEVSRRIKGTGYIIPRIAIRIWWYGQAECGDEQYDSESGGGAYVKNYHEPSSRIAGREWCLLRRDDLRNIADRKYHKALTLTEDMRRKFLPMSDRRNKRSRGTQRSDPQNRYG
jgi:hypothetical protein